MGVKSERGQITVFLSIVLLSVIALAGILVDGSRLITGKAQVKRAVDSAARSALAGYCTRLKEEYCMFALSPGSELEIAGDIEGYIRKNLMIDGIDRGEGSSYIDLYDFRIESISVTPVFNFTDNRVVKNQILEYMKYRAPKEIAEGVWEKLSVVKDACEMSEASKRKLDIDRIMDRMSMAQQKLKRNVEGTIGDGSYELFYICKFNKDGSREEAVEALGDLFEKYKSLQEDLEHAKDGDAVRKRLRAVKRQMEKAFSQLRYDHTEALIKPNEEAERNIEEIIRISEEADKAIHDFEQYMQDSYIEYGDVSREFKTSLQSDIARLKKLVLEAKKSAELTEDTVRNRSYLSEAAKRVDKVKSMIEKSEGVGLSKDDIVDMLNEGMDRYNNNMKYDYEKPERVQEGLDNRKEAVEKAADTLYKGKKDDRDIRESEIKPEELPSRMKIGSRNFDVEDEAFIGAENQRAEAGETDIGDAAPKEDITYGGDLSQLDEEMDFLNKEGKFQDDALSFISSMKKVLLKDLTDLRDEIYVNEYIMGVFKNSVPALRDGSNERKDLDLRGVDKSIRQTFFDSEVEYILHGNPSEKMNKIMTEGQILLVRFALNTIHAYSDSRKRELAHAVAAAVAGWWTGGAGIPILANLIMCGWGMGEAVIDLKDLMDGKSVPFYKSPGDWKLDVGLPCGEEPKADQRVAFSYHDYLRLFLLLKGLDEKLDRIEDLVELNMKKTDAAFKMGNCNMYLRVEAEISMSYLFITRAFVPASRKTPDGRHIFRMVIYEGY